MDISKKASVQWNKRSIKGNDISAANAYLKPALAGNSCQLIKGFATKIMMEGSFATGVEIEVAGKSQIVKANREVIVAASSINSPKLLMLSGIGPAQHLRDHGIAVLADRPGVGQNLQDHLELYLQMAINQPISLLKYWNLFSKARIGLQWLLTRGGPGGSTNLKAVRLSV